MLAAVVKNPRLALRQDEAHLLAQRIGNVQRHYPAMQFSMVATDWALLVVAMVIVYQPRLKPAPRPQTPEPDPLMGMIFPGVVMPVEHPQ